MAKVKKEKQPSPFAGIKEQKGLKAKIKFFFEVLEKYPTVKQAVLFTLFSMICGLTQFIITLVLPMILKAISPEQMTAPFGFWKMGNNTYLFDFTDPKTGYGSFWGFLIGSIWGQTLTFLLNRKKTFNVPDHVVFRAIAYTIMAILIIIMQTAIGKVEGALNNADPDASDFLRIVYNLIAQVTAGMAAFVTSFLGNKFIVMRKWKTKGGEKEEVATESLEEAVEELDEENVEAVEANAEATEAPVEEAAETEANAEATKEEE